VPDAVEKIVGVYLEKRAPGEEFIATYRRIGITPFCQAFEPILEGAQRGVA